MISQIQYKILKTLQDNNCTNRIRSKTSSEILESLNDDFKLSTIQYHLKVLLQNRYIQYGLPDGKTKTFYITFHGEEILENINYKLPKRRNLTHDTVQN